MLAAVTAAGKEQATEQLLADAERHYWQREFEAAARDYRQVLEADERNLAAHAGLVRTLLRQQDVDEAERAVLKGLEIAPQFALLRSLQGDVCFRQARFDEAKRAYFAAQAADSTLARAYWGLGHVMMTEGNRRTAMNHFRIACELDPQDPQLLPACALAAQGVGERIKILNDYLKRATDEDPESIAWVHSRLELLRQLGGRRTFIPTALPPSASIKLDPIMPEPGDIRAVRIMVSFNSGKPLRLLLDTGASGILLHPQTARQGGVRPMTPHKIEGIGDEGLRPAHFGWAERIQIGPLEFRDCIVSLTEKKLSPDFDGVIGTDVFWRYLIKIVFPEYRMELSPLPGGQGLLSPDGPSLSEIDRCNCPELAQFTPVRIIGSDLLIETTVNNRKGYFFLIDSGGSTNAVSDALARKVTGVGSSPFQIMGLSGRVKKIHRASRITLQFGRLRQENVDMLAFDLSRLSQRMGTELSGIIGFATLRHLTMVIDYRDGLVDLIYKR